MNIYSKNCIFIQNIQFCPQMFYPFGQIAEKATDFPRKNACGQPDLQGSLVYFIVF